MGALKVHHTATVDEPWDGPAAVAAMPNDDTVLEYCFAWQSDDAANTPHKEGDDDADDTKGNYRFPHHKDKGGPANIPGCNNGKSRLENSNIPAGDKPGVKSHLQAHIDDYDKKHGDGGADNLVAMRFPGERSIDITNLAGQERWQKAVQFGNMTDEQRLRAHLPRAKRLSDRTDWFRITDYTDGTPARLDIYDEIGWSFFGDGITAASFSQQLQAIQAPSIELHINSPGGDVFDGLAILNVLRSHNKPIDVVVDGLAASAASFIAMAGDTVTMMPNSQMMIHNASGICMGDDADMTQTAELLKLQSANIADVYASRSGKPADEWRAAMKAETWYMADEAVAAGLADKVGEVQRGQSKPEPAAATATANGWNLSFYAYNGRAEAPAPPSTGAGVTTPPTTTPAPATTPPAAPAPVAVDPEVARAAFRAAFVPKKEAAK